MVRKVTDIDPNPRHLTPRQMKVLIFIRDYRLKTGYSPTMAEIAEHVGVSKVTIFEHVTVLEVKGWLKRTRHRARSLELVEQLPVEGMLPAPTNIPPDAPGLVLAGRIAAGAPIEAVEQQDRLDLNGLFQRQRPTFLLTVQGESMIGDQILPGDLAVIEQRSDIRDGTIAVALLIDGEATLKRIYREPGGGYRLEASNPAYPPRFVELGNLSIQGVMIGLIRRLRT